MEDFRLDSDDLRFGLLEEEEDFFGEWAFGWVVGVLRARSGSFCDWAVPGGALKTMNSTRALTSLSFSNLVLRTLLSLYWVMPIGL
jgi:hypothetical protein